MQVNEYIKKNLFSLNFNVLSDIFKENGGELTEEVKSYLKETPWNTNWSILEQLGGSGSVIELPHKIYFAQGFDNSIDTTKSSLTTEEAIINWVNEYAGQNIEFYSADVGVAPMQFKGYNQDAPGYEWRAKDGSGEFVMVYSDSMLHTYDN